MVIIGIIGRLLMKLKSSKVLLEQRKLALSMSFCKSTANINVSEAASFLCLFVF